MLQQILVKTPLYVWAILAFLIYRGLLAARDRDVSVARMLVIPALMLVLALQAIAAQFGVASVGMAAWAAGTGLMLLQRWKFGVAGVTPGAAPNSVRIRGSWAPLAMMVAVFLIKYALAVVLAIRPHLADEAVFAATACGLLGLCNGYFLGQLARGLAEVRILRAGQAKGVRQAAADPV